MSLKPYHPARTVGLAAVLTLVPLVAQAHVETLPWKVSKGSTETIGFRVPHGCNGSETIKVAIKLPPEMKLEKVVAKKGWVGTFKGGIVTFSGGPLAAKTPSTFSITATMPNALTTLSFPTIQSCVKGETSWIESSVAGQAEPDHPAPQVKVV